MTHLTRAQLIDTLREALAGPDAMDAALGSEDEMSDVDAVAVVADDAIARTLRPLEAAACTYRIAFGPRAGQKVLTVQGAVPRDAVLKQHLWADIDGFSLHAAVRRGDCDGQPLEQLCR